MNCLGACRLCTRRVRDDEGRMKGSRAEHHDCAAAIARMDAARRAKGKPVVAGRSTRTLPTTAANPHAVRITNTNTGEVRYLAPYDDPALERLVTAGHRRPRTWNETRSTRGGGHDR